MSNVTFSEKGYTDLLQLFLNTGYECVGFNQVKADAKHLLVRHDIDMSIYRAVRMAKLEAELGIQSTYFVLLTTHFYNIHAAEEKASLRRILELGHTVGLHFDASIYPSDREVLEEAANRECAMLEQTIDHPVESISFHRPAEILQGLEGSFAGRLHAYEPRFFKEIGYCSDSRGLFRFGLPTEHEAFLAGRAMQLLIHPIWWIGSQAESAIDKLERFLQEREAFLRYELARNCIPYAQHSKLLEEKNETA